jgi:hypothetical protein
MRHLAAATLLAASLAPACTDDTGLASQEDATSGALVKLQMTSNVGVVLDDIPAGPLREAAAQAALAQGSQFWTDRATRQVRLTYYRLVFRGQYYSSNHSSSSKVRGPLPLPDKSVWHVVPTGPAFRDTSGGHDIVTVPYSFDSMIVTDAASPGAVEPALATVGGTWDEPFNLPTDPDLLLERTGYSCMDETEYPAYSVFTENTWYFYDDSCVGGSQACHITQDPQQSCVAAIQQRSGIQKPAMHFSRLAYDKATADKYRVGATNPGGADLAVVQSAMVDERKIAYKYFDASSCEYAEGVINQLGWRRVLMFSAVVQNDGNAPVHLGNVTDPTNPYTAAHDFEWSQCHQHYHFSHYGTFNYDGAPGAKRAFCLEDTNRFHNDETTPLTAEHQTCEYQGIGAGWGDEYEFGIPGQWVDITGVDTLSAHALTFNSNPDDFMCEGLPATDATLTQTFDPHLLGSLVFNFGYTPMFYDGAGDKEGKVYCKEPSTAHANNIGSIQVASPAASYVTDTCVEGQIGPNRDCGFAAQKQFLHTCTPGSTVSLTCTNSKAAQAMRVCEMSGVLGTGVACTLGDSLSNTIVSGSTQVSFTCPQLRDGTGGGYSVYQATVVPSQGSGSVSCSGTGW